MFFNTNIKFLRKRRELTQEIVSNSLIMKRSTLSGYENGIAQPPMDVLVRFSDFFRIALDTLIRIDLSTLPESQLRQVEHGYDVYLRGSRLRILATTVGPDNEENIELVSEKAKAGYTSGYADPEYIRVLPAFRLPFLSKQKKYRTFQISGDSMLPIPQGAWVTGVFVQDWNTLHDKDACILLTREEGILFKVLENRLMEEKKLILHSLNPLYAPIDMPVTDIREIWQFVHFISPTIPENLTTENYHLAETVRQLRQDVTAIQTKLNL